MLIDLSDEIESRLEVLANATGQSKAFVAREAIISYLEDIEDVQIAEHRLAELRPGRTAPTSLDEMTRKYGLAD